jgi:hypothetical protein
VAQLEAVPPIAVAQLEVVSPIVAVRSFDEEPL